LSRHVAIGKQKLDQWATSRGHMILPKSRNNIVGDGSPNLEKKEQRRGENDGRDRHTKQTGG